MPVIRRTKTAKQLVGGKEVSVPAVHYATRIDASGEVTGWTADPSAAAPFTDGECLRVARRYEGRASAGVIAFDPPVNPAAAGAAPPPLCAEEKALAKYLMLPGDASRARLADEALKTIAELVEADRRAMKEGLEGRAEEKGPAVQTAK